MTIRDIAFRSRFIHIMTRFRAISFSCLVGGLSALLAGCQTQSTSSLDDWSSRMSYRAPSNSQIFICHAFGCKLKHRFKPGEKDLAKLKAILALGQASPEAERKAIGKAVQWFERRVGPVVGSDKDIGGLDMRNAGVAGQMDCIDEASNTTSYLTYAEKNGLLKYHTVLAPVARGFFLDGRYPHATAVVKEKDSGRRHAVDSWRYDNGVLPIIKPLEAWYQESPSRQAS